jgi:hypothetical protein
MRKHEGILPNWWLLRAERFLHKRCADGTITCSLPELLVQFEEFLHKEEQERMDKD